MALTPKQQRYLNDLQNKRWRGIGRVDVPPNLVEKHPSELIGVYLAWKHEDLVSLAVALTKLGLSCGPTESEARFFEQVSLWRRQARDAGKTPTHAVLRYWLGICERFDWDGLASATPLAVRRNFDQVFTRDISVDRATTDTDLMLVAVQYKSALLAIRAAFDEQGNLVPAPEPPTVLLNPRFFPADDAAATRETLALSSELDFDGVETEQGWQVYVAGIIDVFRAAHVDLAKFAVPGSRGYAEWHLIDPNDHDLHAIHVVNAYRRLISRQELPVLLRNLFEAPKPAVASGSSAKTASVAAHVDAMGKGLRHLRDVRALDESQRHAVQQALALPEGQVLAVNGPPGTGKTTFLRDVIASMWVAPLLEGEAETVLDAMPPVILSAGATNQAVTNISTAFEDTACETQEQITRWDQRWLPGIRSYGWFAAARRRAQQEATRQLLDVDGGSLGFCNVGEDLTLLQETEMPGSISKDVVLDRLVSAYCSAATGVIGRPFTEPEQVVRFLIEKIRALPADIVDGNVALTKFRRYVSDEMLAESGRRLATAFRRDPQPTGATLVGLMARLIDHLKGIATWTSAAATKIWLRHHRRRFDKWQGKAVRELAGVLPAWWKAVIDPARAEGYLDAVALAIQSGDRNTIRSAIENFQEACLLSMRFHMAARIWEGIWLCRRVSRKITAPVSPARRQLQEAAMLAPCIVTTLHSLPRLCLMDGGGPDLVVADLLIIDEASQATPEISGAAFAFARRALVVGDEKQLSPVAAITPQEDAVMRKAFKVSRLPEACWASTGSALAIAQRVTPFADADPPGVFLSHNYRSVPVIVRFCNELSYSGRLVPSRDNVSKSPWPGMSYALTDGSYDGQVSVAESQNGWHNDGEAKAIVRWLQEERSSIEERYGECIEKVVAVLTPFARQESMLKEVIRTGIGCSVDGPDGMVVGTVHKLQGAERPVVLFSTVVTRARRSKWLDKQEALLNVAVSRAKDSFVVFGDREVLFEDGNRTPIGLLGQYIRQHGERLYPRELVLVEGTGKVTNVQEALGIRVVVVATNGSVRDLSDPESPMKSHWVETRPQILDRIAYIARDVRPIVFATDDDREGEAIAWHVLDALQDRSLKVPDSDILRMRFSSLAPDALRESRGVATRGLDMRRVQASVLRHLLDRSIGLSYGKTLRLDRSIGRVQAALLLELAAVLEKPLDGYRIRVDARTSEGRAVRGYLVEQSTSVAKPMVFASNTDAQAVIAGIPEVASWVDQGLLRIQRHAPDLDFPDTAAVLAAAAREMDMAPDRTMAILEDLYLGGWRHE